MVVAEYRCASRVPTKEPTKYGLHVSRHQRPRLLGPIRACLGIYTLRMALPLTGSLLSPGLPWIANRYLYGHMDGMMEASDCMLPSHTLYLPYLHEVGKVHFIRALFVSRPSAEAEHKLPCKPAYELQTLNLMLYLNALAKCNRQASFSSLSSHLNRTHCEGLHDAPLPRLSSSGDQGVDLQPLECR